MPASPSIVIVGAGIAGLGAGHYLKRRGISATILEAADRVGGRMTTDLVDGHVVDRGAQFLSSEYRLISDLLRRLGLEPQICATSPSSAIVGDGQVHCLRSDRPLAARKLYGARALLQFAMRMFALRRTLAARSLSDFTQWAEFDDETASTWSDRELGPAITEYLLEPMLHGFYFQTPEETSRALALALTTFGMRRAQTLALRGGIGLLPEALARDLEIRLNTTVREIAARDGSVEVRTDAGPLFADRVIVAVPAPLAKTLVRNPADELTEALLDTSYSSSINVACITDPAFRLPANLADAYGLLLPRQERTAVAAVGIENHKNRQLAAPGQLLNLMLAHDAAVQWMHAPDAEVAGIAQRAVAAHLPSLPAHVVNTRIYRWPAAEPRSPVGRAAALQAYRKACSACVPAILLAGDYMSMPYTEGACESGYWAARLVSGDDADGMFS